MRLAFSINPQRGLQPILIEDLSNAMKKKGIDMVHKFTMVLEADQALSDIARQLRSAGFRKQAKAIEDVRLALASEADHEQASFYAALRSKRAIGHMLRGH
jgi:hypothetical protein